MTHNRLPCVADDSCQFSHEHIKQLDCSHYLEASAEVSPFKHVSEKCQVSDGEMMDLSGDYKGDLRLGREGNCVFSIVIDKVLEMKCTDIPIVITTSVPASTVRSSWAAENSCEIAKLENAKRPSSNHSFEEVVNKRARHEEQTRKLEEFLGIPSVCSTFDGKLSSDVRGRNLQYTALAIMLHFIHEPEGIAATTALEGNVKNLVASNLSSLCLTCIGGELESRLDQHDCYSPRYCQNNFQRSRFYQIEGLYSPFSEYFHCKNVPIGSDHQADVPEYRSCSQTGYGASSLQKYKASSSINLEIDGNSANKWLGARVMLMPDLGSISMEAQIFNSRSDCDCPDAGSIECVRHHVMEARESLERTLGNEKFMGLGFCNMGEIVAQRWTKQEQNLFLEVVLSNPASLGKNFWSLLSHAFPSRSVKELVSYYFNVFILRKRAEQNRSDSLSVDSDNDEWQESREDEFAMSEEEEENSVVESPFDGDAAAAAHNCDVLEQDETDSEDCNQCLADFEDYGLNSKRTRLHCDKRSFFADDLDVQDDSCISSESQFNVVKHAHENLNSEYRNGVSGVTDYEYVDDHRDSKLWDIDCIGASEKDFEFLPICHVIEEMLGKEFWEEDAGDDRP